MILSKILIKYAKSGEIEPFLGDKKTSKRLNLNISHYNIIYSSRFKIAP